MPQPSLTSRNIAARVPARHLPATPGASGRPGSSAFAPPDVQAAADSHQQTDAVAGQADALAQKVAYSVAEAAFITGLSRDLLYDQMRTGKLAYLKVGRRRIITRQHLEAFLNRQAS